MVEMSSTFAPDAGKTPEQLLAERTKRLQHAMDLKQPDRIPIMLPMSYMLADFGGITRQELHSNPEKAQELLEKAGLEYQPDTLFGVYNDWGASLALGDRMTKWPGHGLGPNGSFQFDEHEFMKAEDYDDFLEDPADWGIRVYMPRAFSELSGLSMLPPLGMTLFGHYNLPNMGVIAAPPMVAALQALGKAVQAAAELGKRNVASLQRMAALGFPAAPLVGSLVEAPFDFMSDTLRGMRGIMLDILQRPEKLLAAEAKVARFQTRFALDFAKATGLKYAFFPLHRGSDGFMSLPQFERFYWPQLKGMLVEFVENGITPFVFYEGVWDQRLKYLTELPRAKTLGMFQDSDVFKVKEVVGDTMCIFGGMPNWLLQAGTEEAVRDRTKKVCEIVGKGGGFVMSTTVGEMEGSRPELVKAWISATHEYGTY